MNPILFAPSRVSLLHRLWAGSLTLSELRTRLETSVGIWFAIHISLHMIFSTFQLIGVALFFTSPELQRPVFGSFGEAYTIRGFWGSFWHQMFRHRLTAISDWVTYDILRLPRAKGRGRESGRRSFTRLFTRYTHIFFVFLLSGIYHQACYVTQGLSWGEARGATTFFVLMGLGILLEDFVQWLCFGDRSGKGKRNSSWTAVAVGYVWVVLWFTLAAPHFTYPGLRRNTGSEEDNMLPFSVVEYVLGRK